MARFSLLFGAAALLAASACGDEETLAPPDTQGTNSPGTNSPGTNSPGTNSPGTNSPGSDGGSPGTGTPGELVDATGVWWTEIETIGSQDLPTVGVLKDSKIRFVMRVAIQGDGPNQTATFEFCELQTEWQNPLLAEDLHVIGFRPAAAAAFTETLPVNFSGLSVGSKIPVPDLTFIGGGDATGAILDEDGDGHPAITAYVRVILAFEVAEVITIKAKLDVNATDENTLAGTVEFGVKADILDSSSGIFVPAGFKVSIVPDSNAVPITVRRLPGGGDCSAIPSTIGFSAVPPATFPPVDSVLGPQYKP